MKIFVTGGSGFVGGAAIKALSTLHDVSAMSRRAETDEPIQALGAEVVRCSLDDINEAHLQGCEIVIHSAARVESWGNRQDFWNANVLGTERILKAAQQAGVKRFIHISSEATIFAGQDMLNIDESYPYPTSTPFLYSETKQAAEKLVLAATQADFDTIVLRPRMIWGPGDKTIVPEIKAMVDAGKFAWIGGGHYQTETTHIDNLVHGITLALEQGVSGERYFILDDGAVELRSFITQLMSTAGVGMPDKSAPKWLVRSLSVVVENSWNFFGLASAAPIAKFAAFVMSADFTVNSDKAARELSYKPAISRAQGLQALAEKT